MQLCAATRMGGRVASHRAFFVVRSESRRDYQAGLRRKRPSVYNDHFRKENHVSNRL